MYFFCGAILVLVIGSDTKRIANKTVSESNGHSRVYSPDSNEFTSYEDGSPEITSNGNEYVKSASTNNDIVTKTVSDWIPVNTSTSSDDQAFLHNVYQEQAYDYDQASNEDNSRNYEVTEDPTFESQTEYADFEEALKDFKSVDGLSSWVDVPQSSEYDAAHLKLQQGDAGVSEYGVGSHFQANPVDDTNYSAQYDTISSVIRDKTESSKNLYNAAQGTGYSLTYPANSHGAAIVFAQAPSQHTLSGNSALKTLKGQFNGVLAMSVPTIRYGTRVIPAQVSLLPISKVPSQKASSVIKSNHHYVLNSNKNINPAETSSKYKPNSSTNGVSAYKVLQNFQKALKAIDNSQSHGNTNSALQGGHHNLPGGKYTSVKFSSNLSTKPKNHKIKNIKIHAPSSQNGRTKVPKEISLANLEIESDEKPKVELLLSELKKIASSNGGKYNLPSIIIKNSKTSPISIHYPPTFSETLESRKPPNVKGFSLEVPESHESPAVESEESHPNTSPKPIGYSLSLIIKKGEPHTENVYCNIVPGFLHKMLCK